MPDFQDFEICGPKMFGEQMLSEMTQGSRMTSAFSCAQGPIDGHARLSHVDLLQCESPLSIASITVITGNYQSGSV